MNTNFHTHTYTHMTDHGSTPLHLAAAGGHAECFYCLLQHKGNPTISNNNGENPLDVARKHGKPRAISKAGSYLHSYRACASTYEVDQCNDLIIIPCCIPVDGERKCKFCEEKAIQQKLQEIRKPSPIHAKISRSKDNLFTNPLPPLRCGR